jgi:PadR family transcriptional regulator, regulatory protein PadR
MDSTCFPNGAMPHSLWETQKALPLKTATMKKTTDVHQGTLALMVLKTLDVLGPLHGHGLARRIEQISGDRLTLNTGTLYPLLLRLEQEGAITSKRGPSENNRSARFYQLTKAGRKQLEAETRGWEQTTALIDRFFAVKAKDFP